MAEGIEVGDTVYLGEHGVIHWIVEYIEPASHRQRRSVMLRSGMTKRQREAWLDELRLHSKGTGL